MKKFVACALLLVLGLAGCAAPAPSQASSASASSSGAHSGGAAGSSIPSSASASAEDSSPIASTSSGEPSGNLPADNLIPDLTGYTKAPPDFIPILPELFDDPWYTTAEFTAGPTGETRTLLAAGGSFLG